jgi:hypothetical protein
MRRRDFIRIFGLAAALPLAARAQQAVPVIGFIGGETPEQYADRLGAFHQGLREIGFVEGQNVPVEYRWAQSQYGRLPELAADLVRQRVPCCPFRWMRFPAHPSLCRSPVPNEHRHILFCE